MHSKGSMKCDLHDSMDSSPIERELKTLGAMFPERIQNTASCVTCTQLSIYATLYISLCTLSVKQEFSGDNSA